MLVLGDAVLHFDVTELRRIAADEGFQLGPFDSAFDRFALSSAMGFASMQDLDVNGETGLTIDLNLPVSEDLVGAYDCVFDAGVLCACSDPGAAIRNIFQMTRPGGLIIHICALTGYYGRVYYDIHPRLFEDFYRINGAELIEWSARAKYTPHGPLAPFLRRLIRNKISRYERPGNVFLADAGPGRISWGKSLKSSGEPNVLPNNAVGVYAFRKNQAVEPRMPAPTPDA
jgi:SAM-dependent methyltransferase